MNDQIKSDSEKAAALLSEISDCRQLCHSEPEKYEHHLRLGSLLMQYKDYNNAVLAYRRALEINAELVDGYLDLAFCYRKLGFLERAIVCYEDVLRIAPDNLTAALNLGAVYMQRDDYQLALDYYKKALAIDAQSLVAQRNLFLIHFSLANFAAAFKIAEACIKHPNAAADDWWQHGVACLKQDLYDKALTSFYQARKLGLNSSRLFSSMARAYHKKGALQQAEEMHLQAIEVSDNVPDVLFNFGEFLLEQERKEDAFRQFQEAVKLAPEDGEAWFYMGVCMAKAQPNEALRFLERAGQLKIASGAFYKTTAEVLERLNRISLALDYRKKVQLKLPTDYENNLELTLAWLKRDKPEEAWQSMKRCHEVKLEDIEKWRQISMSFASHNFFAEELYCLEKMIKLDHKAADLWLRSAQIAMNSGLPSQAYEYYLKAETELPEDPKVWLELAAALFKTGDTKLAFDCLSKAFSFCYCSKPTAQKIINLLLRSQQLKQYIARLVKTNYTQEADIKNLLMLGEVLTEKKEDSNAQKLINFALQQAPYSPSALAANVWYWLENDEPAAAIRIINDKIGREELRIAGTILLGECYAASNDLGKAEECFNKIQSTQEYNHYLWRLKGWIDFLKQDYRAARIAYEAALKLHIEDYLLFYRQAMLEFSEGNLEQARQEVVRATNINSRFSKGWELLGDIAKEQSKLPKAKFLYFKSLRGERKNNNPGWEKLAAILVALGEDVKAKKIRKALQSTLVDAAQE